MLPVADLLPDLPRPILLVGDGACAYREEIRAYLGSAAHFAPEAFGLPCGGAIGLLGTELLARGDVADLASVEPRYLRRSQAERVRRERMASAGG